LLSQLLKPDYEELIRARDWSTLRELLAELDPPDRAEILEGLSAQDSALMFRILPRNEATEVFEHLPIEQQTALVETLADEHVVRLLDEMAPDDRTRLLEELPAEATRRLVQTLSPEQRKIANQLLGYPERSAGRSMTPEYVAIKPEMTVSQALSHIREQARASETINVVYVTDTRGRLLGDVPLATLVLANPVTRVEALETRALVSIPAMALREDVVATFEKYDRVALPVTDTGGVLVGIITVDDVLDVQAAEATEDIQKLGGTEALDAPYLDTDLATMVRKRAGWLAVLLLGEMLTATAMAYYEHEIQRAVVLALFVPLIISSGGNSGSQATSLIIRALALREVELSDWWRVFLRELRTGLVLGLILGVIGFVRVQFWPGAATVYGLHYTRVALTVAGSLVGVVLFGSVVGSMLPFALRRVKLDPATASAPFVATLVDVTGLIIYFTVANMLLRGVLL
jgi:magnesium transporter